MKKTLLLFFLLLCLFYVTSCTIEHRVYRKGIYVEHKEQNKKIEKKRAEYSGETPGHSSDSTTSQATTIPDSTVTYDRHTSVEDSIQKTIPINDTATVDEKGKNHHGYHSPEISFEPSGKSHAHEKTDDKKSHHKKSVKQKIAKGETSHHQPQHHGNGNQQQIGWLGELVYWLAKISEVILLILAYYLRYDPLGTNLELYIALGLLGLSIAFALLAMALAPLARDYDSRHSGLIDKGVKNAKFVLAMDGILLLIAAITIGIIFLIFALV